MRLSIRGVAVLLVLALGSTASADDLQPYAGRYGLTDGGVVRFFVDEGTLGFRPSFWTTTQWLAHTSGDEFVVADRRDRKVTFERAADGSIAAARVSGIGDDSRLPRLTGPLLPVELLHEGKPEQAATAMIKQDAKAIDHYAALGQRLVERMPSRVGDAVRFLQTLERHAPQNVIVRRALGDALVAAGRRDEARAHYEKAAGDAEAALGLRMLQSGEPGTGGWTLPFTLAKLFETPTASEIASVTEAWSRRDLRPHDVQLVATHPYELGGRKASVRILAHRVNSARHFTAVIIAEGAAAGATPIVLDLKGVNPDYFPRDLGRPLDTVQLMGDNAHRFIYVVPAYRGEVLIVGETKYVSEGDRTDVWDGATDDALAALNTVLKAVPEADPSRVCSFGRSRGGAVSLLAAARDPRIRCAVGWAAPADQLVLMGQSGFTRRELVAEGLRRKSGVKGLGGQFIETFLRPVLAGERELAETRQHLIASSPLYFAARLPRVQLHYGIDDPIVPIVNGRELKRLAGNVEAHFYEGFGHDTDTRAAYRHTRQFLEETLLAPRP